MFYRQLKPLYLKRYKRSVVSTEQQINQSDLVQKDTVVSLTFFTKPYLHWSSPVY